MTRSPDLVVAMKHFFFLYCSATRGEILDLNPPVPVRALLSYERQITSVASLTDTHDDQSNNEARQGTMTMLDDSGNRGDNEKNVANQSDQHRPAYGLVSTPPRVCDVRAEEWNDVDPTSVEWFQCIFHFWCKYNSPESVEGVQTISSSLTHAESARLAVAATSAGV